MAKILAIFGNVALFGQERSNIHVFNSLKQEGFDFLLLVNDRGFHWHLQPEVEAHNLKYKKIRFPWNFRKTLRIKALWLYLHDTIKFNIQFYKAYKSFKPDYIHIANDFFYMTLTPVLFWIRCPIIFRLGDKPTTRYFWERWLWKKLIIKKTQHFVCISNFIASELKEIDPDFKRFSIIHNVPTSRKANIQETLPKKDPDLFTVLYVGQINKEKGVDVLFETACNLLTENKNIRFIFAGALIKSELYENIRKNNAYIKFRNKIIFTDKIQNIKKLYDISDVLAVPSIFEEPLSNVVGEAKLSKCPAIVFPSGGLTELITHKENGYICQDKTPQSLKEAILFYYNNPDILLKNQENALNSLQSLGLTQERFLHKWKTIYSQEACK